MRDEDGTFVIEISPTMRLIILGGGLALAVAFLFWKFVLPGDTEQPRPSTVVIDFPDEFPAEESVDALAAIEASFGVLDQSPFNIETLSKTDRDQLGTVFKELVNTGFLSVEGEESQIFDSLIERSLKLAPNRSLRFFSEIENFAQQQFSISRLYRYWFVDDAEAAYESLKNISEITRFRIVTEELPRFAELQPQKALDIGIRAKETLFKRVTPDIVRPLIRVWGSNEESKALEAVRKLPEKYRAEGMQGLALAKLDGGSWKQAQAWAAAFSAEDRDAQFAKLTVLEYGVQENPDEAEGAIETLSNPTFRAHLERSLAAKKLIAAVPPDEQLRKAYRLMYSLDAYDAEGRQCVVNCIPDTLRRQEEALFLRYRFLDFSQHTFYAYDRCFLASDEIEIPNQLFRDLLEMSRQALEEGDLEASRNAFLPYLYNVPYDRELHALMTDWSKKDGSWLGENLSVLDNVHLPAAKHHEVKIGDFLSIVEKAVKEQADVKFTYYFFEGLDGAPTESYVSGEYGDVTAREAITTMTRSVALIYSEHDFGLLGYYFRDEDTALYIRWPDQTPPPA